MGTRLASWPAPGAISAIASSPSSLHACADKRFIAYPTSIVCTMTQNAEPFVLQESPPALLQYRIMALSRLTVHRTRSRRLAYMRHTIKSAVQCEDSSSNQQQTAVVLFAHANGFCKEVWKPVWEDLASLWTVTRSSIALDLVAWDSTGHGDSEVEPGLTDYSWSRVLVADLREMAEEVQTDAGSPHRTDIYGVGHSMGGATFALAETQEADTRTSPLIGGGLLLIEPILLPDDEERGHNNKLTQRTLKRRASWPSSQEAHSYFATRFNTWDPRCLAAYVEAGMASSGDSTSSQVQLKCSPTVEAGFYGGPGPCVWKQLSVLSKDKDVVVMAGEESVHLDNPKIGKSVDVFAEMVKHMGPRARLEVVKETGHFLPMEKPGAAAAAIVNMLSRCGEGGESAGQEGDSSLRRKSAL